MIKCEKRVGVEIRCLTFGWSKKYFVQNPLLRCLLYVFLRVDYEYELDFLKKLKILYENAQNLV